MRLRHRQTTRGQAHCTPRTQVDMRTLRYWANVDIQTDAPAGSWSWGGDPRSAPADLPLSHRLGELPAEIAPTHYAGQGGHQACAEA